MTSVNHRFGIQDIIAVAVLTGTATVLLRSKLETLGVRLSPALRQGFVDWWPLLLILVGMILLFAHYRSGMKSRDSEARSRGASLMSTSASASASTRGSHES
jgi:hypothetical protein